MRVDHFTPTDFAKAGPLFNPQSQLRMRTLDALRSRQLVETALQKCAEIDHELDAAKRNLVRRQRSLYNARLDSGINKMLARSIPRVLSPTFEADGKRIIAQAEVDVGHALDRVWAAQRAVAMWDHVYGDLV